MEKVAKVFLIILAILSLLFSIGSIIIGILFKIESWEYTNELFLLGTLVALPTGVLFYKAFDFYSILEAIKLVYSILIFL